MASSQAHPATRARAAASAPKTAEARAAKRAKVNKERAGGDGASTDGGDGEIGSVLAQLQTADGERTGAALR